MNFFYFFSGTAVGAIAMFWLISTNYKLVKETSDEEPETEEPEEENDEEMVDEDFHEESGDDTNYYYVQFPHLARPVEVAFEEPLHLNHSIAYRNLAYTITNVIHKNEGHSIYVATLITKSNGSQEN